MFENIGMGELLLILFVILILFGGKKIPEIARSLGKGISEFKKGMNELKKEIAITDDDLKDKDTKKLNWSFFSVFNFIMVVQFNTY